MTESKFKDFGININILKAITKLGYENPLEVQNKVIPLALQNKDIIVKSQTGSGKTAAFAIPLCDMVDIEEKSPQALVLTPTRELAVQVKDDISNIGRFQKIRVAAIFGKQPMSLQVRTLKQRVHVVVGTPGRTLDHIEKGTIDLGKIKYLIVDEADKMLNMGFIDQVEAIIKSLPKNRTTMLLSATLSEEINKLCKSYMNNPIIIEIESENPTTEKIEQVYYEVNQGDKTSLLSKIIYTERPESCIIFCNTKDMVDSLVKNMKNKGFSCNGLHGGMEQRDRLEIMDNFKKGEFRFLIATDVAARGIHIEDMTHVINYDVPVEKESFVHRTGRTGRAHNKGVAITFVSNNERQLMEEIEEYVGYKVPKRRMPSKEEVEQGKNIFIREDSKKSIDKSSKFDELNKEITKLYIGAGKKKKIRPGDIVGAITSIQGITGDDIGIIDVLDYISYVDILNGKGSMALEGLKKGTIKKKKVNVQVAKN